VIVLEPEEGLEDTLAASAADAEACDEVSHEDALGALRGATLDAERAAERRRSLVARMKEQRIHDGVRTLLGWEPFQEVYSPPHERRP